MVGSYCVVLFDELGGALFMMIHDAAEVQVVDLRQHIYGGRLCLTFLIIGWEGRHHDE